MTSLAEQLRAIADRIEAADQAHADARMDLLGLLGLASLSEPALAALSIMRDGSSIEPIDSQVEPGRGVSAAGASTPPPSAPPAIAQPGSGRGENPPATGRPTPAPSVACPGCDRLFPTTRNVKQHRRFCKGHPAGAAPSVPSLVDRLLANEPADEDAVERRWPKRPSIAERIAARDAGRVGSGPKRVYSGGGE